MFSQRKVGSPVNAMSPGRIENCGPGGLGVDPPPRSRTFKTDR